MTADPVAEWAKQRGIEDLARWRRDENLAARGLKACPVCDATGAAAGFANWCAECDGFGTLPLAEGESA